MRVLCIDGSVTPDLAANSFCVKSINDGSEYCIVGEEDTGVYWQVYRCDTESIAKFMLERIQRFIKDLGDMVNEEGIVYPVIGSGLNISNMNPENVCVGACRLFNLVPVLKQEYR